MKVQQVQQVQQPVFQFAKLFWINYFVAIILEATTLLHYYTNHSFYSVFYSVIWTSKNNPYYWSHILRFVRHRVTAPSFSVRKYVYFVHTILTVYLTILYTFIVSAQGGAALAPRPPQITHSLRPQHNIDCCIQVIVIRTFFELSTSKSYYFTYMPAKHFTLGQMIHISNLLKA